MSQAQWCSPVITALERLRQEDHKFKASLWDVTRPCLKDKKERKVIHTKPLKIMELRRSVKEKNNVEKLNGMVVLLGLN